jgi:plasmid stabilization system protein ParE
LPAYLLSPQAAEDLEGIFEYTLLTWGEEQFERYRRAITRALEAVAADPMLAGSKARDDLLPGVGFSESSTITSSTGAGHTGSRSEGSCTNE